MENTDVTFFELAEDEIAAYVAPGEPMDKAGAYGIREMVAIWFRAFKEITRMSWDSPFLCFLVS